MEGGDLTQMNRSFHAKNFEIRNSRTGTVDSLFNEWTDEKHNMYLSSIEAAFVNQLYGKEHISSNFLSLFSRAHEKTISSHSNPNGQFKVLRRSSREDYKSERAKRRAGTVIESRHLSQSVVTMDGGDLSNPSTNLNSPSVEMRICAMQLHRASVSSRAEVTDQNFSENEQKLADEPCRGSNKKKLRGSAQSIIIDQPHN